MDVKVSWDKDLQFTGLAESRFPSKWIVIQALRPA